MWTVCPQGFDAVQKMGSVLLASQLTRACGIWVQAPGEPTGYEVMWTFAPQLTARPILMSSASCSVAAHQP